MKHFLNTSPSEAIKTLPKRYGIYARFSDEKQNPKSVEDQIEECKQFIERQDNGYLVEDCIYYDEGISGSHIFTRQGYQHMMQGAEKGDYDIIVTEDLSRVSRDQEDTARFHKVMQFNEIPILTLTDGEVNEITVGYKGTINTVQLKYLAQSVKRGQRSKVKKGSHANGIAYGYDRVKEWDSTGEPIRGKRIINEEQAAIVRRIYQEYTDGKSPRQIAKDLNKEGILSPRGGQWNASTINGNRKRRNGILQNHLYAGYLIYGRTYKVKHPATGKSLIRINPESEWIVTEVPQLRLVEETVWNKAQERKEQNKAISVPGKMQTQRRPQYMLSGLLKCGSCGGNLVISSKHGRYRCAANRDKGTCDNYKGIRADIVEKRVVVGLQQNLLSQEAITYFIEKFQKEWQQKSSEQTIDKEKAKAKVKKLSLKIDRIIDAIVDGIASTGLQLKLAELEQEKVVQEAILQKKETVPRLAIDEDITGLYRKKVAAIETSLKSPNYRDKSIIILRGLLDKIVVSPLAGKGRNKVKVELYGLLSTLVSFANGSDIPLQHNKKKVSEIDTNAFLSLNGGAGSPAPTFRNFSCSTSNTVVRFEDDQIIIKI